MAETVIRDDMMVRNKLKIRVVGGGWYGCHHALYFKERGHNVTLVEKEDAIFQGASGRNQSRLHLGFHYPRSDVTRVASRAGVDEFRRTYPSLCRSVACNIYAVAQNSLIDFQTYLHVMRGTGSPFFEIKPEDFGLTNLEGAVQCGEYLILHDRAKVFFEQYLKDEINVGVIADPSENDDYDFTIDCTFGAMGAEGIDVYEPCVMHKYRGPGGMAVTIMDGPFGSIYPAPEPGTVTLTSVMHTPLGKPKTYADAQKLVEDFLSDKDWRYGNRNDMQKMIAAYVPFFDKEYEWYDYTVSIRGVPASRADSRQCIVQTVEGQENWILVQPGKIDSIFSAARRVHNIIKRLEPKPV